MTSPSALDFEAAVSATDVPALCEAWRDEFAASAEWVDREDVQVPRGGDLAELCRGLGLSPTATECLVEHRASFDDPRVRRLGAHVQWMIACRYTRVGYLRLGWPPVFSRVPLFYAHAGLGLARRVAAEQAACGVDPAITRATLWDLGQQVDLHRRIHGETGMNKGWWLSHHLSHHLFRIGRLQFQRARAGRAFGPVAAGECYLDLHIPEDGPLDPDSCDASLAEARAFFARQLPDETYRHLLCTSWLLDPVLAEILPEGSNILAFQRRFDLHAVLEGPSSVFEFVFDRPDLDRSESPDLSGLPRDTRLRAAIVEHYARGGVIRMGLGAISG